MLWGWYFKVMPRCCCSFKFCLPVLAHTCRIAFGNYYYATLRMIFYFHISSKFIVWNSLRKICTFSCLYLSIKSFIYLDGFIDTYFILWVIVHYYYYLNHCSNYSRLSCQESFLFGSCVPSTRPCLFYFSANTMCHMFISYFSYHSLRISHFSSDLRFLFLKNWFQTLR